MSRRAAPRRAAALCLIACAAQALAQAPEAPAAANKPAADAPVAWLTLDQALGAIDEKHPALRAARAGVDRARAGLERARAETGFNARLEITPQYAETAIPEEWRNDTRARVFVSKPLYDFGLSDARERAGEAEILGQEELQRRVRARQRYEIMARYFDVILADLRYAADNENMAFRYTRYDRAVTRRELGELTAVDVLELETAYREALSKRTRSAQRQFAARQLLAMAMNQPGRVLAELERPALPGNDREAPDFDQALAAASRGNHLLAALGQTVSSAESRVEAARSRSRPRLSAELEAAHYNFELPSRYNTRGTLNLEVPLYQGGIVEADVARARAELEDARARLAGAEYDLRREALAVVQEIEALLVDRKTSAVRTDYRDRYVDRARSIYELELQTTLGDAFTQLTEAQWAAEKVEFELALAWARLDILLGRDPGSAPEEVSK